jgi:hypothetical protein
MRRGVLRTGGAISTTWETARRIRTRVNRKRAAMRCWMNWCVPLRARFPLDILLEPEQPGVRSLVHIAQGMSGKFGAEVTIPPIRAGALDVPEVAPSPGRVRAEGVFSAASSTAHAGGQEIKGSVLGARAVPAARCRCATLHDCRQPRSRSYLDESY